MEELQIRSNYSEGANDCQKYLQYLQEGRHEAGV